MMCMTANNLRRWWSRIIDVIGGPNLTYVRVDAPLWRSVPVILLLLSSLFCYLLVCMFRVAAGTPVLYSM